MRRPPQPIHQPHRPKAAPPNSAMKRARHQPSYARNCDDALAIDHSARGLSPCAYVTRRWKRS
jgi:hypothetical protein